MDELMQTQEGKEELMRIREETTGMADYGAEDHGNKAASFDGDADRLIYWIRSENPRPHIIDGDKQFAFIMTYIKEMLTEIGVPGLSHAMV